MAKPSQAHEQTMEEIHASIRRMMTEEPPAGDRPPAPVAGPSPADNVSRLFVPAQAETPADAVARPGAGTGSASDGRRGGTGEAGLGEGTEAVGDAATAAVPGSDNVVELAIAQAIEEAQAELHAEPAPVPEPALAPERGEYRSAPATAIAATSRPDGVVASVPATAGGRQTMKAAHPTGPATTAQPLLSVQSGAAVAGAFEQLAREMFSGSHRTVDGLVEDLLRPMLRDWLDDNLPPLVERLVREEIERVSRGRR